MGGYGSGRSAKQRLVSDYHQLDMVELHLTGMEKRVMWRGHEIVLTTTRPYFGGTRQWFLCPACDRRSRILYLSKSHGFPQCRECLGLTYPSKRSDAIERQRTYEKHLLANWGYLWSVQAYYALPKHYLRLTPEIVERALQSALRREIEFTNHAISFLHHLQDELQELAERRKKKPTQQATIPVMTVEEVALYLAAMVQRKRELEQLVPA